ncbi:hypothetical protein HBI81_230460 [Parastagonospora nodorum]|nr:hypothetical protein HBI81_230460 [Parastagonospora nodorum]
MAPLQVLYLAVFDDSLQPVLVHENLGLWKAYLWPQNIEQIAIAAIQAFPRRTLNITKDEIRWLSSGARGYAVAFENTRGVVVLIGDEDAREEHLRVWFVLSKIDSVFKHMPHEKVLQQSLGQLPTKLRDGELEEVEEKLRGWKIVEHTPQSAQDRLDKVEHIRKQHQDMLVAVERRMEFLARIKVPISAAREECEVMDIPMREMIRTSLAQITSFIIELEKIDVKDLKTLTRCKRA